MLKINKKTILEHIFKIYSKYGFKEFYLLGGYKINELIKFSKTIKKININIIDTGRGTTTAGRLLHVKKYLKNGEIFLTYGDSLANFKPKRSY